MFSFCCEFLLFLFQIHGSSQQNTISQQATSFFEKNLIMFVIFPISSYNITFSQMKYPIILLLLYLLFLTPSYCDQLNDTITCINSYISTYKGKMSAPLFDILVKAFPNTMSTTVQHYNLTSGNESMYIITGDIEAMWLRDSTNQFIPYIRMPNHCTHIPAFTRGLLNTQAQFLMVDAYTNAFKRYQNSTKKRPSYLNDISETLIMGVPVDLCRRRQFATQQIWQRKWQVDSPSAFLRLAHEYYQRFNQMDFLNIKFFKAVTRILAVFDEQTKDTQFQNEKLGKDYYTFKRSGDELPNGVIKTAIYTGMIKTGFRPSDSPNELPYNIPGNAMASSYLALVANDILSKISSNSVWYSWSQSLCRRMLQHSQRIRESIYRYGIIEDDGLQIFAYQVDGMGSYRAYDDSNLPCLLSLAYLKFIPEDDPVYLNTRKFILSQKNKYFYARGSISGVGSSHTDHRFIWPLALTIQILTSKSNNEIRNCLQSLVRSAKDNLMHQSFSVDNPDRITREWFAWANSFFGEMIMHLAQTNPEVLQ